MEKLETMNLLIIASIATFILMVYGIYYLEQKQEGYLGYAIREQIIHFVFELFMWPFPLMTMICSKEFKEARIKLLTIWILGSTIITDLSIIVIFHLPSSLIHAAILMFVVGPITALIISLIWLVLILLIISAYGCYYDHYEKRRTEE